MESPPPTPTPPNAPVPQGNTGAAPAAPIQVVRRYPKPPPFFRRLVMLCLRPETWAEAARYPTSVTVLPLLFVILLGGIAIAIGNTSRFVQSVESFASQYDTRGYPPLTLSPDGTLAAEKPLTSPIRAELRGVPFVPDSELAILGDPSGATAPDSIKTPGYFVTDKEVVTTGEGPKWRFKLETVLPMYGIDLPPAGQTKTINSATLSAIAAEHKPLFIVYAFFLAGVYAVLQSVWSIFMIFILSPLVVMAAAGFQFADDRPRRRLLLPRRAAFRIVAALLVPIVLVDSILRAADFGLARVVGMEWTLLVWLIACGALAVWAGIMAHKMYQPREQPRRAH